MIKTFVRNVWLFRKELSRFQGWDFGFNLDLLCRSLEITRDAMLSDKAVSEDSEQYAMEIQRFLDLIYNYKNSVSVAEEKTGTPLRGFGFQITEEEYEVYRVADEIEKESWDAAFSLLNRRMRHWWD